MYPWMDSFWGFPSTDQFRNSNLTDPITSFCCRISRSVTYVAHLSAMCKNAFTAILLCYLIYFYAPHVYFTASLPTHGCRLLWVAEEGEVHLPIVPHLCNKVRRAREVAWETSAATREQEGQTPQDQLPLQQGPTSQTSKHRSPHNRRLVKSKWGHR